MGPAVRYTRAADGVHIAYQLVGEGPIDLVFVAGWVTDIEAMWEEPALAKFLSKLGSFSRLITFDKRGVGHSDRVPEAHLPSLETRMDDLRAVMDAAGSSRAIVFGISEGGPMAMLFAATYPERTLGLVLYGTAARYAWSPDFPQGMTQKDLEGVVDEFERSWGTRELAQSSLREWAAPGHVDDERLVDWLAGYLRRAASPGAAIALERMNFDIDVRNVLPSIHVPTLVIARTEDVAFELEATKQIADQIPSARLVELPGADHFFWIGDQDAILREIEAFVETTRDEELELDRVLATVLFTDIVASTDRLAAIGDGAWRSVLDKHQARIRSLIGRFRGREIGTTGDGFLATFDGPIRAVRCALAARDAMADLDLQIRAGLHTGEIELSGDDVRGIAVHISARVAALAAPSEVLVSSTVRDLVAGSRLTFEDGGRHALKGVPGEWQLYRVVA